MGNVKIDLIDLIRRVLHQWKFIVITMLICGLAFEGIGYARAYMEYRQVRQGTEQEEDKADQYLQSVEDAEANLTDREIVEVQVAANSYMVYLEQYEEELSYCQDAIKMQLDANHVPTYTLHYSITSPDTDNQASDRVVSVMTELVVNEEVCDEIRSTLGWDTDLSYIGDLITVQTIENNKENVTVVADTGALKQASIQFQAPDKDACLAIAEIIKNHIQQESANLQDGYGSFELTLLDETYMEEADNDLRTYQDTRLSAVNSLRSAIASLSTNMTDDQEDCYYALIAYYMYEDNENEAHASEEEEITEEVNEVSAPDIIRWRFIILGLFLGLVIACGYILLRYILAANLRVKEDMEYAFHIPLLGYFSSSHKKQRFTKEERIEMICAGIRVATQKEDMKNIYLTGTGGDGESEQIMEQIEASFADSDVQIVSGRDVACDPASLEQMTASDGVVFIERVDRSPYADIQKEVELCQTYNIPIIGSVVIE